MPAAGSGEREQGESANLVSDLIQQSPQPGIPIDGIAALTDAFNRIDRLYQAELLFDTFREPSLFVPGLKVHDWCH